MNTLRRFICRPVANGRGQSGFVLLDAVIAILIFSIGILGMVSLQGAAIKLAGDAQYRTNAAMLADQVIAQMWGDFSVADLGAGLKTDYQTGGGKYTTWATTLVCGGATSSTSCLPGSSGANKPLISIDNSGSIQYNPNSTVTVQINWQGPNDTSPHNYVTTTQISR